MLDLLDRTCLDSLTEGLRRLSRGPLWGGSGRVQRRAVGLRGWVYFVGTHTRSTVPRGRSAAALGNIKERLRTLPSSRQVPPSHVHGGQSERR